MKSRVEDQVRPLPLPSGYWVLNCWSRSFNRDAEGSAENDLHADYLTGRPRRRALSCEIASSQFRARRRSSLTAADQGQVLASELLWVAVKRIRRIHSNNSTLNKRIDLNNLNCQ